MSLCTHGESYYICRYLLRGFALSELKDKIKFEWCFPKDFTQKMELPNWFLMNCSIQ